MNQTWRYKPAADLGLSPEKRLRSERREPGLISYIAHQCSTTLLRIILRVYHRLRIEGSENLPRNTPFIIVGNHASHLDALVIAACLPTRLRGRVFPLAAGDVFFEAPPIAAFAAAVVNALPMWRKQVGRHALDDLKSRLVEGDSGYILFPEGARSRDGQPLKWKPGVGMMVAETNIPVIPCRLWGCFEAMPPGALIPRPKRIRVRFGTPIAFGSTPNTREGWETVANTLKDAVMGME